MNRDALRPIVLAVICAIAIILASATLATTTQESQGSGVGVGGGEEVGASEGDAVDVGGSNNSGLIDLGKRGQLAYSICVHQLRTPLAIIGIVFGLLAMAAIVKRRVGTVASVGLTMSLSIPVTLLYLVLTSCGAVPDQTGMPEMFANQSSGGGGVESATGDVPSIPVDVPIFVYVLVGAGLVAILVATLADREGLNAALAPVLPSRDDPDGEADPEDDEFGPDTYAVGRAAGRAADRIETGTDVENEVYRAWVEMTRHLDVDHPESSTPLEFARAAEDAGMDRDDVDELTEQFELVRYGGAEATEDRERRAIAALRRIEDEYADEGWTD